MSSVSLTDLVRQETGDLLQLELADGHIHIHRTLLKLASRVFCSALTSATDANPSMKVEGSLAAWTCILEMLYPIYPRPELSFARVAEMLRVLHMYDFSSCLQDCLAFLDKHFPASLSHDPESPCYVLTWLVLADDLQLEQLRYECMQKFRELAQTKRLEPLLFASIPQPVPAPTATHATCQCFRPASAYGHCSYCHQTGQREAVRWFQGDSPELAPDIKRLSRAVLEELLALVVIVSGGGYSNTKRPGA